MRFKILTFTCIILTASLALFYMRQSVMPSPKKPVSIHTLSDLGQYLYVLDRTVAVHPHAEQLRMDFKELSVHPMAEKINFDLNPEFRKALEKVLSGDELTLIQIALLEDYVERLRGYADRQQKHGQVMLKNPNHS